MANTRFYYLVLICTVIYAQENTNYEIINLGHNVNSPNHVEFNPYITPDGKKLFFGRENHPENTHYNKNQYSQDIWYSTLQEDGTWSVAKHLSYPFNTLVYNTLIAQTSDGTIRYIKGCFDGEEYVGTGFSYCVLKKDGWSDPKCINIPNYERMCQGNTVANNFSSSNNILLMSFSEKKGDVPLDIYVSFLKNGKWTSPKKLPISTDKYDENTPFLAADNVTLYFSSDRPGGYGSNDIYVTRRLDDTWEKWSEPINLGSPINDNSWDAYFTIPASGEYFYMVKSGEIVKVKPKKNEIKPKPVVLIKGKVINSKNNKVVGNASINYIDLETGEEVGIAHSAEQSGEYSIVLPFGKHYSFQAKAENYYSVTENMDLKNLTEYKEIEKDLFLKPIEKGQVIRINNIFFEFNKADLKPESFYELDNLVQLLKDNPRMEIKISGHTDNLGNDEYNLKLSQDRAAAVLNYLVSKGIDVKRLSSEGFGETQPVADNNTEEGRAINRRVEFTILKK